MPKTPFTVILDRQQEEAAAFCRFMENLVKLPEPITALETTQRLLQRMAFAYVCLDYLHQVAGEYRSEDYNYHAEELGLREHATRVYYLAGLASLEWEGETAANYTGIDEELLELLLYYYKSWWGQLIRQHYPNEIKAMELFADQLDIDGGSADKAFNFIANLI